MFRPPLHWSALSLAAGEIPSRSSGNFSLRSIARLACCVCVVSGLYLSWVQVPPVSDSVSRWLLPNKDGFRPVCPLPHHHLRSKILGIFRHSDALWWPTNISVDSWRHFLTPKLWNSEFQVRNMSVLSSFVRQSESSCRFWYLVSHTLAWPCGFDSSGTFDLLDMQAVEMITYLSLCLFLVAWPPLFEAKAVSQRGKSLQPHPAGKRNRLVCRDNNTSDTSAWEREESRLFEASGTLYIINSFLRGPVSLWPTWSKGQWSLAIRSISVKFHLKIRRGWRHHLWHVFVTRGIPLASHRLTSIFRRVPKSSFLPDDLWSVENQVNQLNTWNQWSNWPQTFQNTRSQRPASLPLTTMNSKSR